MAKGPSLHSVRNSLTEGTAIACTSRYGRIKASKRDTKGFDGTKCRIQKKVEFSWISFEHVLCVLKKDQNFKKYY